MNHILIVEDDIALSNGIVMALKSPCDIFTQAYSMEQAEEQLQKLSFALMILDLNLPDGNGLLLLTKIRKSTAMPIIILTANDLEADIISGLTLGADDYITKPFSLPVLRARAEVQLRKSIQSPSGTMQIDNFTFSFENMIFLIGNTSIELSKTEQKLLHILVVNKGTTIPRSTLVDKIWTDGAEYVDENALSVTIKRLRNKLEPNPSAPVYIKTVYGIGYTWAVK